LFSFRRWFGQGRAIDEIFASILADKLNRAELSEHLAEAKTRDMFQGNSLVRPFIEREANDVSPAPSEEIKDILKMLEERRQATIRNSTTVVAGLLGGIIGATLTFLLATYTGHVRPTPVQTHLPTAQGNNHW
jgi:hypothetical protein